MSNAIADWQAYTESVYSARNAALAEIAVLTPLITQVSEALKPSYSVSGPTGSRSVDWAGELNALNHSLDIQMGIVERMNKLILQFPYQLTSHGS